MLPLFIYGFFQRRENKKERRDKRVKAQEVLWPGIKTPAHMERFSWESAAQVRHHSLIPELLPCRLSSITLCITNILLFQTFSKWVNIISKFNMRNNASYNNAFCLCYQNPINIFAIIGTCQYLNCTLYLQIIFQVALQIVVEIPCEIIRSFSLY